MKFTSIQAVLSFIRRIKSADEKAYLVGGAIRDFILGKQVLDFDFAIQKNPIRLAKQAAEYLGGKYFVLDNVRNTSRVIYKTNKDLPITMDFALLQGDDIGSDLIKRDFTFNAIAYDVDFPDEVIDPLSGRKALQKGILQFCSSTSFSDDPLRILRAIRFTYQLDLSLDKEIEKAIKVSLPDLQKISVERIRDELFQILDSAQSHKSIKKMSELGILDAIFQRRDIDLKVQSTVQAIKDWSEDLSNLRSLESWMLAMQSQDHDDESKNCWKILLSPLDKFTTKICKHLHQNITAERTRAALIKLAALLLKIGRFDSSAFDWDGQVHNYRYQIVGSNLTREFAKMLALSQAETDLLSTVIKYQDAPRDFLTSPSSLDRRKIYRFFQHTGEYGLDICLIALALSTSETNQSPKSSEVFVKVIYSLLDAWFNKQKSIINPPRLLTGDQIMKRLGIKSGPILGKLIQMMVEDQASGKITTKGEAYTALRRYLDEQRILCRRLNG